MCNAFTEEEKQDIERLTKHFNEVARDFDPDVGKAESRREREARNLDDINLTYGEIEFKSFY